MNHKVILVIRDGWGYRDSCKQNAICEADTPNTDELMSKYPNTLIAAAGQAVGLPDGYQGNSEVGHMTIGSGRIIFQSLRRINKSIEDGEFYNTKQFNDIIQSCEKNQKKLHLIGLLQTEGVHSHADHLYALLRLCEKKGFKDVVIHVVTDGRDAPPTASLEHVKQLQRFLGEVGFGEIATICGRYWSMDRDKRWDRTEKAYKCIIEGQCKDSFEDAVTAIKQSHEKDVTDEFIEPAKKQGYGGIQEGDGMIFYNFRTDRTRQLTKALVEDDFKGFERVKKNINFVAMTQYYKPMNAKVAFKDVIPDKLLGQQVAEAGFKQLRISETEKYAHVTFFFNAQAEEAFEGEDRIMIQSPKVATYDLKPEMSAHKITDELVEKIGSGEYDFIVTNLVNCDMVGHTGKKKAIIKAVETVDECIGKIIEKALEKNYVTLIFADHGNAEDQRKQWITSHTKNLVPLILVTEDSQLKEKTLREGGGLKDIAATTLKLMGIDKPAEMSGENLVSED